MNQIKFDDLDQMQKLGRKAANGDANALEDAAIFLAIARVESSAFMRLWIWFEAGARNTVDGEDQLTELQKMLKSRAEEIYEEIK